ncbi:MAG: NAD-dependent epimerase/dehydratase family protein [Bacteroidota bacterium]|nr:NAD-dependent epimerase/dehydratase family protein [Bacteroidota bacterium]MEE2605146.1 NAD-dependent epimerase/dehydratase family protein [Bacteroidota bacterium]
MKKTVLITGAAGFLGSHLCDYFLSKNYKVIGIDNLITGNLKNLSHLKSNKKFEFMEIDINYDLNIVDSLDYILHFASPASPIDYLKIPLETLRTGSVGTENILKIALKNKARILIASTSEVYGDPLIHPQHEKYCGNVDPVGPRGVYDEAKRFQEALTTAYHTYHGLDIRIARIFNTYGSRMRVNDGRAIPTFIGQVLRGESLTVFGDGSQTRSFCYVDDMIEGIYKLLHSSYNKPINLGNPDEIALIDFAKEIITLGGNNNKIIFKPLPLNDPVKRKPDISKAMNILNWKPLISRKKGLENTMKYFKTLSFEDLNKKEHKFA